MASQCGFEPFNQIVRNHRMAGAKSQNGRGKITLWQGLDRTPFVKRWLCDAIFFYKNFFWRINAI